MVNVTTNKNFYSVKINADNNTKSAYAHYVLINAGSVLAGMTISINNSHISNMVRMQNKYKRMLTLETNKDFDFVKIDVDKRERESASLQKLMNLYLIALLTIVRCINLKPSHSNFVDPDQSRGPV